MSGGVGPSSDISLPQGELQEPTVGKPTVPNAANKSSTTAGRSFFTFRQLNALAVATVISVSGMVNIEYIAFVLFSLLYMYFISKVAFPPTSPHYEPSVFGEKNKILGLYVFLGAVIGLFLPIVYIFEGIFEGDKEGIKAAAPHVFLLASQVFIEGVTANLSLPIRVFVPVFYTSLRITEIMVWLRAEIEKVEVEGTGGNWRRLYVGRALAVGNLAFWSSNLFGFLLPVYLPKAFKKYYSNSIEKKD